MLGIVTAIFKSQEFVEGHTFESNKQTIVVKDQFKIKIDEIGRDGSINQQVIIAYAEDEGLINKLKNLEMYKQVYFVVDISYYRGQLSKIVVLDVIDNETEIETVGNIFKKYVKREG